MSHYCIEPSMLRGKMVIPPSKSQTLRAILFASMADGRSKIILPLSSPDTDAMKQSCRLLGARIDEYEDHLIIHGLKGCIQQAEDVLHAGNSGIVLRFCSALGALAAQPIVITGDASIRHQRPMQPLLTALTQLGVSVQTMRGDGYAPVILKGPIQPGRAKLQGEDSQPVSALLIAGSFAKGPIELHVKNPGEKPWVGLTLNWLDRLGIPYENRQFEYFRVFGNAHYSGFDYHVPGDWSSAAFPIAAALITRSELTLHPFEMDRTQGDKHLIEILQKMGAVIEVNEAHKSIQVKHEGTLKGMAIDLNACIDAITILAVIGCYAEGETILYNAAIARQKECDRIGCITKELRKMGADISETEDGLIIRRSRLKGAFVESHEDHRMAMSLAVAGLGAEGETQVHSVTCISKTFPNFLKDFQQCGALIRELS